MEQVTQQEEHLWFIQAGEGRIQIRPTRHGLMAHLTRDIGVGLALATYGEWCFTELEFTARYAHGLVLDVGAHLGTHSLVYAQTAWRVIAFEPQAEIYKLLAANVTLNALDNVEIWQMALSDHDGEVAIPRLSFDEDHNWGGTSIGEGEDTVDAFRLDALDLSPSFMKIDAEGSELAILQGAQETIARCRPIMYIENDREAQQEALCKAVEELGYEWQAHLAPVYRPDNFYKNPHDIYLPNTAALNILCLPRT